MWSEEAWLQLVPNDLRAANIVQRNGEIVQTSHSMYHQLLTEKHPTEWLDHCVFYLASVKHDVGIFILMDMSARTHPLVTCRRIGSDCSRHIVLVHTMVKQYGHYECVQYEDSASFHQVMS